MNSKSSFILLLICGMTLAALVARDGRVLLLVLPLVLYLLAGALQSPVDLQLRADRTVDKVEIAAEQPVTCRVIVHNEGQALDNLLLADAVPQGLRVVDGNSTQRLALAAGESAELEYTAVGTRGLYAWRLIEARASDPFGLFELRLEAPASAEVRVRPAPMKLQGVSIRPRSTLQAPGPAGARRAGAGTDFWGIREYRTGDPLRRLNWRLAGRYPRRLFTNEYEGEEVADLGFILDARRLTDAHEMEDALFEASVCAAGSLSEMFLNQGNRVALLVFGEAITCRFPGSGKEQLSLLRRDLARARLGPNLSFRYLEYFPRRLFPSRSVIVSFSGLDERDLDTYARLRAFGYDILLISPNPVEYMRKRLPVTESRSLAVRAARLERTAQLKRLIAIGVGVIDWQVEQPLDLILQRAARYMARRRKL